MLLIQEIQAQIPWHGTYAFLILLWIYAFL